LGRVYTTQLTIPKFFRIANELIFSALQDLSMLTGEYVANSLKSSLAIHSTLLGRQDSASSALLLQTAKYAKLGFWKKNRLNEA